MAKQLLTACITLIAATKTLKRSCAAWARRFAESEKSFLNVAARVLVKRGSWPGGLLLPSVIAGAQEVQGHVGLIPNHPTVVSWRNVEEIAGLHFDDATIIHRCIRPAREHQANMLD